MNPLTNMKNVTKLSERELTTTNKTSWHDQYRDSAWVFIGGLPYDLTEGDIICIFSQYGEIVNINLIRDKDTGKSKGFCFLCYEDQRSTDLSVDNLNGIKILNRSVRVDHVSNYKVPKQGKNTDLETKKLYEEGCAPTAVPIQQPVNPVRIKLDPYDVRETLADQISSEIKLPNRLPIAPIKVERFSDDEVKVKKEPEEKKSKKKHKKKKSKKHSSSSEESNDEKKKKKKHKKRKTSKSSSEESSKSENEKTIAKNKKVEDYGRNKREQSPERRSERGSEFRTLRRSRSQSPKRKASNYRERSSEKISKTYKRSRSRSIDRNNWSHKSSTSYSHSKNRY